MKILRYLKGPIEEEIERKMVFIGGPRQVGKTTLAKSFLSGKSGYLNYDDLDDRKLILNYSFQKDQKILILDEIHKYKLWRTVVKGLYDKYGEKTKIIVTGSARLDHFRKGGDSLFGRYSYFRLHPITLSELSKNPTKDDLQTLLTFGGFPEPLIRGEKVFLAKWQKERTYRVLTQDLRDLERVKEVSLIELLAETLPGKVGAPLSLKNLAGDLQVAQQTVDRWIKILENLYFSFRIPPFGSPKIRAVKKEQKLYFWDWSILEDLGAKFENLVASHLLKFCHFREDVFGETMELRFIRDTDKREIDFVVIRNKKPIFAVECKSGEKNLSPAIKYFKARTSIPKFFQVHLGSKDFGDESVDGRVLPFQIFEPLIWDL